MITDAHPARVQTVRLLLALVDGRLPEPGGCSLVLASLPKDLILPHRTGFVETQVDPGQHQALRSKVDEGRLDVLDEHVLHD